MFERFTKKARAVVTQAQEEARTLRHDQVGPGHLLLALTAVEGIASRALAVHLPDTDGLRALVRTEIDGLDPDALASIGIDLTAVREATEAAFGEGALDRGGKGGRGHLRFTSEAKKALELSLRVAIKNGHKFICDGHILLALLMLPQSAPVRALERSGADLDALRGTTLQEITAEAA
ncbi:Clp protease N-terminal domain-containing protein [Actinocorallia sp. B10E7]|uniref:Clp protease N-terminal domain-containing protein n=1 Tax=Actinocorallia sp. B10E7 TaxID=3153558 RepID=UPI00325ED9AB